MSPLLKTGLNNSIGIYEKCLFDSNSVLNLTPETLCRNFQLDCEKNIFALKADGGHQNHSTGKFSIFLISAADPHISMHFIV